MASNNIAFFYDLSKAPFSLICSKEYIGTIQTFKIGNDYASVLYNGQLLIHPIRDKEKNSFSYDTNKNPRCIVMDYTSSIVYFVTVGNHNYCYLENKVNLFYIDDLSYLDPCCTDYTNEIGFIHSNRIIDIVCNNNGNRCIIVEEKVIYSLF